MAFDPKSPGVYVNEVPPGNVHIAGVGTSTAAFVGVVPDSLSYGGVAFTPASAGVPVLVTNFTEFKAKFGDFHTNTDQSALAHAVFGFFTNGGTRCYVMRAATIAGIDGPFLK